MPRRLPLVALAATALAFTVPVAVHAQQYYPGLSLSYITPSATVSSTEVIEVWVRASLDAGATALDITSDTSTFFGFDGQIPRPDGELVVLYGLGAHAGCYGSFWPTDACYNSSSPYLFSFNDDARSLLVTTWSLAAGSSHDFLFGFFTPQNGPVAPGTYTHFYSGPTFGYGFRRSIRDASGDFLGYEPNVSSGSFDLATTCAGTGFPPPDSCKFERTVAGGVVPEPATLSLFGLGLVGVGVMSRRKRA